MEKKTFVYVVMGETGEYSDRSEWIVCAFSNEDDAKKLVVNANRQAKKLSDWKDKDGNPWRYCWDARPLNKYDPNMRMDYGGTEYFYVDVELRKG